MRGGLQSTVLWMGVALGAAAPVRAATLLNSNFNLAATGSVSDGTTVDGMAAELHTAVPGSSAITVVNIADGDNAVTLTDNISPGSGSNGAPYLRKSFTGTSTTATGDNFITGSFEFRRLSVSSGSEGSFRFLINTPGSLPAGTSTTLVLIRVSGSQIQYSNGSNTQTSLPTSEMSLALNTTYKFEVDLDLSSTLQDTWRFRVKDDDGDLLYTSALFNTSVANGSAGELLFTGGVLGAAASPDPYVRLDDLQFSSSPVPEPGSAILLIGGLGALLVRRRANKAM